MATQPTSPEHDDYAAIGAQLSDELSKTPLTVISSAERTNRAPYVPSTGPELLRQFASQSQQRHLPLTTADRSNIPTLVEIARDIAHDNFEQKRAIYEKSVDGHPWASLSPHLVRRAIQGYFEQFPLLSADKVVNDRRRDYLRKYIGIANTWSSTFPEILEAEALYTELATRKNPAASNALAVLLAAYGQRLSDIRVTDASIVVPVSSGRIKLAEIAVNDIVEDPWV